MKDKKLTKKQIEKKERRLQKRTNKERWRRLRLIIFDRDDYRCQLCGKDLRGCKGNSINCHHIFPRQYKEFFFDDLNLITLCSRCHHWDKDSPHQNALVFTGFLMTTYPVRFSYLIEKMKKIKKIAKFGDTEDKMASLGAPRSDFDEGDEVLYPPNFP